MGKLRALMSKLEPSSPPETFVSDGGRMTSIG